MRVLIISLLTFFNSPSYGQNHIVLPWLFNTAINQFHWENDTSFTFDTSGVLTYKSEHHPVAICQYALTMYEHYKISGDSTYLIKFYNQVEYLLDTLNYTLMDNSRIGYPYLFKFKDLNPPWYSSLAQSEVVLVLLRVCYIKKDRHVEEIIKKVMKLMITPVAQGGHLSIDTSNFIWLEEYPSSRIYKNVLNGFLICIHSIYEYAKYFNDNETTDIFNKCIYSLKNKIDLFESKSWIIYDLGLQYQVHPWYLKAQIIELYTLYLITKDDFFLDKALIWSTYAYNSNFNFIGCNLNNYNFIYPAFYNDSSNILIELEIGKLIVLENYVNEKRCNLLFNDSIGNNFERPQDCRIVIKFKYEILRDSIDIIFSSRLDGKIFIPDPFNILIINNNTCVIDFKINAIREILNVTIKNVIDSNEIISSSIKFGSFRDTSLHSFNKYKIQPFYILGLNQFRKIKKRKRKLLYKEKRIYYTNVDSNNRSWERIKTDLDIDRVGYNLSNSILVIDADYFMNDLITNWR